MSQQHKERPARKTYMLPGELASFIESKARSRGPQQETAVVVEVLTAWMEDELKKG